MEKVNLKNISYQALVFPLLDVLLNGGNLFIHLYISWYLTPGEYGILNAFSSLLFVLMIFGMSMQTYIAKRISSSEFTQKEMKDLSFITNRMIQLLLGFMILISYPMVTLLRGTLIQYTLILFTFAVQGRLSYFRGILQGKKHFIHLNISFYMEMTAKLSILIPFLRVFKSIEIALFSILIGMMISYITTKAKVRNLVAKEENLEVSQVEGKSKKSIKESIKGFLKVFSTQIYFYYFTAVVLILTNYFMGEASGLYAVSTRYGQIFIHIGLSIITVLIPYTSAAMADPKTFKNKVSKLLLLYSTVGLIALIGYAVVMPPLVKWLFDSTYHGALDLLIPQAIAYYILSIAFYMASMEMVGGNKEYIGILSVFSLILLLALMTWHNTLLQIVYVEGAVYTSMAAVLIFRFYTRRKEK